MFFDCSRQIADNLAGHHSGIAAADLDGDGAIELIVGGRSCPNRVLKWQAGALRDVADPLIADPSGCACGIVAADVDGDGREEIYILNSDCAFGPKGSADRLFACFGERWIDLLAQSENHAASSMLAGRAVAALDRTGEGRYGFLVTVEGGPLRLYELNRRGLLAEVAEEAGVDLPGAGRGVLCLPLMGEHMDVVALNEAGPNFLFRNLGDGTFEEIAAERGLADPWPAARAIVPIDMGDGCLALFVANWDGPQRLFQQTTAGLFEDVANVDLSTPVKAGTVVAADFDNDGYQELFFNIQDGPNRLFAWRDDDWREVDIGDAGLPKGVGSGAAAADLDGDGRLELLVAHNGGDAPSLALFRPFPNDNHWLRVHPLTASGAPARGAVVHLFAGGRRQTRTICAGSGYLCQMEPVAHFGLGAVDQADRIEVRWPDGAVATIENPPCGRLLTVPYPPA